MSFFLSGDPDEKLRLKSFTSSSRGARMTIKIECETDDPYELAYALMALGKVQRGQRAKQKPKATPLALPKPEGAW